MKLLTMLAAALALTGVALAQSPPGDRGPATAARARVTLDNASVRAYRTTAGGRSGIAHGPGVIVWLRDGPGGKAGRALWVDDAALPARDGAEEDVVVVQPLERAAPPSSTPPSASKPGDAPFTGMSFKPLFENARVSVLRARMERDAREAVHTHASDTIVVHLSGGQIEDTAGGKTVVNRWKPGDVEFESRGSSHSARNISDPVDVVLVALKP
jgi:quercetin dioxygenase-like cupin family protein